MPVLKGNLGPAGPVVEEGEIIVDRAHENGPDFMHLDAQKANPEPLSLVVRGGKADLEEVSGSEPIYARGVGNFERGWMLGSASLSVDQVFRWSCHGFILGFGRVCRVRP